MNKIKTVLLSLLATTPLKTHALIPDGGGSPAPTGGCGDTHVQLAIDVGCKGEGNAIFDFIGGIVRFIAPGVGLVIVLMIIIGGIRYIASGGNPEAAAAAKKMVTNALLALIIFIFLAAILNFIIPGGLL